MILKSDTFNDAVRAKNYFKFIGKSSKVGIFTSTFEGYPKSFSLKYDLQENQIKDVVLSFAVSDLDTDNSARNEKMRETCLNFKEFPSIEVKILEPIQQGVEVQDVKGEMSVRGQKVPLLIHLIKATDGEIKGSSSFKLSEAKIPDPSILVASVRDEFKIEFQVKLP
jgi:hypothetical protein